MSCNKSAENIGDNKLLIEPISKLSDGQRFWLLTSCLHICFTVARVLGSLFSVNI